MRTLFIAAMITTAASAAPLDMRTPAISANVAQELQLVEIDIKPGESTGWHIHHGIELAYIMQGDLRVTIAQAKPRSMHAGDSFKVARDSAHELRNTGTTPARLIVSYMMDKGAEQKILIAKPPYAP